MPLVREGTILTTAIKATLPYVLLMAVAAPGRAAEPAALPAPAARQVDFHKDILAILANSCAKCHAGGKHKGGFSIDTRETLLKGGESGAAVVVGGSAESRLVELVAGLEPQTIMPQQSPRLSAEQIGLLRAWIDQGLAWEPGFSFKRTPSAPLAPRAVSVPDAPSGTDLTNPIDRILAPYFTANDWPAGGLVDDRAFLRRA